MKLQFKNIVVWACALLGTNAFAATHSKVNKDKVAVFDSNFVIQETAVCKNTKDQDLKVWLTGEIKKVFDVNPVEGQISVKNWHQELSLFKIDEKDEKGEWISGSPGTYGEVNAQKLKFYTENDSKTLAGEIVDVGNALPKDLSNRKDLENKVWLVSPTPLLPSFLALSLEAKLHKALGILIYDNFMKSGAWGGALDANTPYALPVIRIPELLAQSLKLVGKPHKVELVLKTDFPIVDKSEMLYVKAGGRPVTVALHADIKNCGSLAKLLAVMKWGKETNQNIEGTTFVFSPASVPADSQIDLIAREVPVSESFDPAKDLGPWLDADQNPDLKKETNKIFKQALSEVPSFQSVMAKEAVGQYRENLKQLEKLSQKDLFVATKIIELYRGSSSLADLASDIHALHEIHNFAERGQWNKVTAEFKKVHGFDWVANVSPATFIEYKKLSSDREYSVDPNIWQSLQGGRAHLDQFIENLEKEIDRLTAVMNDKFFKLDKSMDALRTRSNLTSKEKI